MTKHERWASVGEALEQAHDFVVRLEAHQTAHTEIWYQAAVEIRQGAETETVSLSGAGPTILEALEEALLR